MSPGARTPNPCAQRAGSHMRSGRGRTRRTHTPSTAYGQWVAECPRSGTDAPDPDPDGQSGQASPPPGELGPLDRKVRLGVSRQATSIPLTRMPICTSLRANQEVVIGQITARAVNILT